MEPVKIPITICPHFSLGGPRGHYILAKRLFTEGAPKLIRQQLVGYNGFLFITVVHPYQWDTTFKIAHAVKEIDEQPVIWLGTTSLYTMSKGFKTYLSEDILKANKPGKIEGVGIFRKHEALGYNIYYLEIPKLNEEVLSGRKELR